VARPCLQFARLTAGQGPVPMALPTFFYETLNPAKHEWQQDKSGPWCTLAYEQARMPCAHALVLARFSPSLSLSPAPLLMSCLARAFIAGAPGRVVAHAPSVCAGPSERLAHRDRRRHLAADEREHGPGPACAHRARPHARAVRAHRGSQRPCGRGGRLCHGRYSAVVLHRDGPARFHEVHVQAPERAWDAVLGARDHCEGGRLSHGGHPSRRASRSLVHLPLDPPPPSFLGSRHRHMCDSCGLCRDRVRSEASTRATASRRLCRCASRVHSAFACAQHISLVRAWCVFCLYAAAQAAQHRLQGGPRHVRFPSFFLRKLPRAWASLFFCARRRLFT
jgi:hypothetical protein